MSKKGAINLISLFLYQILFPLGMLKSNVCFQTIIMETKAYITVRNNTACDLSIKGSYPTVKLANRKYNKGKKCKAFIPFSLMRPVKFSFWEIYRYNNGPTDNKSESDNFGIKVYA